MYFLLSLVPSLPFPPPPPMRGVASYPVSTASFFLRVVFSNMPKKKKLAVETGNEVTPANEDVPVIEIRAALCSLSRLVPSLPPPHA